MSTTSPVRIIALDQVPNTNRSAKTTTQKVGAGGVLESLTVGIDGGGTVIQKGDCYLEVSFLDTDRFAYARPIMGYVSNSADPSWTGRLHINSSDYITITSYNAISTLAKISVRGRLVVEP